MAQRKLESFAFGEESICVDVLTVKTPEGTMRIYHEGFPHDCTIADPELVWFVSLLAKGNGSPMQILEEHALIASNGDLPLDLCNFERREHRRRWIDWLGRAKFHQLF